ncbi:MAG TPA: ABC transporter substrate-binding protein, partial [Halalkalibaculum sp.]|nr:ABC transporter substrate-binding protein [Halalkalibaculum sp.]
SEGYEIAEYTKYLTADSLKIDSLGNYHNIDAVYAPFTGQAAPTLIDLLLIDLEATNSEVIVLGSQEWGATAIPDDRLGNRTVYFSESYYINSMSDKVEQFRENYSNRFGIEANRFAMIGYDAASYLLQTLERVKNPALLKNALSRQPLYEGLISNIRFDGTHVNQEVKIFSLSAEGGIQPAN